MPLRLSSKWVIAWPAACFNRADKMKTIDIDIPTSASMKGELYAELHPDVMLQDILEVDLGGGFYIDVGWYPEHDPKGEFWIRTFRDTWDEQFGTPIKTRSPEDVRKWVELIAEAIGPYAEKRETCGGGVAASVEAIGREPAS